MRFNEELKVFCLALGCMTFLETVALLKGVNGVMMTSVVGGMGIVCGFILKGYLKGPGKKKL